MNHREQLLDRVRAGYRAAYGEEPQAIFAAPGRVNLIGEHTDYNDGLVLPCAIDRETMIAIGPGEADMVDAVALDFAEERDAFRTDQPVAATTTEWANHVRGVAYYLKERGVAVSPAKLAIAGNVPIGAGLSSSASLGVVSGLAFSAFSGQPQPPEELARIAQLAENRFVGTQCGIMDQMASACARDGHALLLDCRDLSYRHVPFPRDLALVIIDSGQRRELANSAFNDRRFECEQAAEHYGVSSLRDLTPQALVEERGDLPERIFDRAHHVVSEIGRVEPMAIALARADVAALSALMQASHVSLDVSFDVTTPEINRLQSGIRHVLGRGRELSGGVRMTGGGFGGCLVAIVRQPWAERVIDAVERNFNRSGDVEAKAGIFCAGGGTEQVWP